jgi:hypothetical protein
MNKIKELQEKQMGNLLKAIELKSGGISDKALAKIVDYIIDREVSALMFDVALFKKEQVKSQEYNFHGK